MHANSKRHAVWDYETRQAKTRCEMTNQGVAARSVADVVGKLREHREELRQVVRIAPLLEGLARVAAENLQL